MTRLQSFKINNYITVRGVQYKKLNISYQIYGKKLHTAPIVLVNHALTGNSDILSKEKGWWNNLIGNNKCIDTQKYTIIAMNIPGNGYDGFLISSYHNFVAKDIATLFNEVLLNLNINKLFAIIGGSIGGSIAWELAALNPKITKYLIPIASNWIANDWIIAHCSVQENILLNSKQPLKDARKVAMLSYRTPQSFNNKFNRLKKENSTVFNVQSWLNYHGEKLTKRYHLLSYLMVNHLLCTVNITENKPIEDVLKKIKSKIIQISVSSDLLFLKEDILKTKKILDYLSLDNEYYEINSIDGHDAFLIEQEQISQFLKPIFN